MSTENIKLVKEHIKLKAWALEVKTQQESGLNPTAWCRLNDIKPSSFYHRLKRVRDATLENAQITSTDIALSLQTPSFAEIDLSKMNSTNKFPSKIDYANSSNIIININSASIEIPANASPEAIATILNVVKTL